MRRLSPAERDWLGPYIARIDLDNARVVDGRVPWYLLNNFSAIVRGNTIYMRRGVYVPGTVAGIAMLGHELVHVSQYRSGMNWLKYLWSARKGYRNSHYEKAAYALQARIERELSAGGECPGRGALLEGG